MFFFHIYICVYLYIYIHRYLPIDAPWKQFPMGSRSCGPAEPRCSKWPQVRARYRGPKAIPHRFSGGQSYVPWWFLTSRIELDFPWGWRFSMGIWSDIINASPTWEIFMDNFTGLQKGFHGDLVPSHPSGCVYEDQCRWNTGCRNNGPEHNGWLLREKNKRWPQVLDTVILAIYKKV